LLSNGEKALEKNNIVLLFYATSLEFKFNQVKFIADEVKGKDICGGAN